MTNIFQSGFRYQRSSCVGDADNVRFSVDVHVDHFGVGAEVALRGDDMFLQVGFSYQTKTSSAVTSGNQVGTAIAVEIAHGFQPRVHRTGGIHDHVPKGDLAHFHLSLLSGLRQTHSGRQQGDDERGDNRKPRHASPNDCDLHIAAPPKGS